MMQHDGQGLSAGLRHTWSVETAQLIADTRSSLVYRVTRHGFPGAIAKVLKPDGMEELTGFAFLKWRNGLGSVRLIDLQGHACLLEDAGTLTLEDHRESAGDRACAAIFCEVISSLHLPGEKPAPLDLVPLERRFAALFDRAENEPDGSLRALLAWASSLARNLLATQSRVRPLHGDIHHGNIVSGGARGWLAIDPHGVIGDPAYEAANVFGNPLGARDDILDPERTIFLARMFSEVIGCPQRKIAEYAAAHAALSMCWYLEDGASQSDRFFAVEARDFLCLAKTLLDDGRFNG
jgi:streptomycin 6-kinase